MLIHRDASFNWVQSIHKCSGHAGGYSQFTGQADVSGGYQGASVVLDAGSRKAIRLMRIGHVLEWVPSGRPMYQGVIMAIEGLNITLKGTWADWLAWPADWISGAGKLTGQIVKDLMTAAGVGACRSNSQAFIAPGTYTLADAQTWSKQKIKDVIDAVNAFEGYEYGGFISCPGSNAGQKAAFYWRPADLDTIHLVIDAATLKDSPQPQPDSEGFGNQIRGYYGNAGAYIDVPGSTASQNESGIRWQTVDAGSDVTTNAPASQAANAMLNGEKVDGKEAPSAAIDITITRDTHIQAANGVLKNIFWLPAGINVLLTNLGTDVPRTLNVVNKKAIIHAQRIKWDTAGEVTISGNNSYNPAVLLARLKGKVA